MKFLPYMEQPLRVDVHEFLDELDRAFVRGDMSVGFYHLSLGRALAYADMQLSQGILSLAEASAIDDRVYALLKG